MIGQKMLLQGSTGESPPVRMLQNLAGLIHIHSEVLQLWQAGKMALVQVAGGP